MAERLEGLSVTNPKGLNEAESWSLSLDSPLLSVELALIILTLLIEFVFDALLLQHFIVEEEMGKLRVGENTIVISG